MTLDRETLKKLRRLIVFTLVVFILLWRIDALVLAVKFLFGILSPFFIGAAIAFILSVPMARIEKTLYKFRRKNAPEKVQKKQAGLLRPVSLILTLLFVVAILALVVLVIFPELGRTISGLGRTIHANLPKIAAYLNHIFQNNAELSYWIGSLDFNWNTILHQMLSFFRKGADIVLGSTFSVVQSIFSGLTTFLIGFVFACYILMQKEKLAEQCRKILFAYLKKERAEQILEICTLTHRTFSNFLTGQCTEAIILGGMFFVAMTILRFPYALLVGVLIAVTALIPIFGAFIGCVVAAFLILMVNPWQALGFIVLFLVLQQLEGNFIYPHVVGGSVGLPSIWVLVAVTLGGSLLGIVGMLIFIPTLSVLYTLLRRDVYRRLKKKKQQEVET